MRAKAQVRPGRGRGKYGDVADRGAVRLAAAAVVVELAMTAPPATEEPSPQTVRLAEALRHTARPALLMADLRLSPEQLAAACIAVVRDSRRQ